MTEVTTKRKPRTPSSPSNTAVSLRMDHIDGKIADVDAKVEGVLQNQGLNALTLQRVENKMDAILLLVGSEEEDGQGGWSGVGILGRMRRVEEGQSSLMVKYRTWIAWGGGFVCAMSFMVAVVWWLIADKLEVVLK